MKSSLPEAELLHAGAMAEAAHACRDRTSESCGDLQVSSAIVIEQALAERRDDLRGQRAGQQHAPGQNPQARIVASGDGFQIAEEPGAGEATQVAQADKPTAVAAADLPRIVVGSVQKAGR